MNVLVCVMAAKCRHLFSVLTSGPITVGAQRGTCHMRTGCRVQRSKHRNVCINIIWICINFALHDMFYCAVFNLCNFIMHVGLKSS